MCRTSDGEVSSHVSSNFHRCPDLSIDKCQEIKQISINTFIILIYNIFNNISTLVRVSPEPPFFNILQPEMNNIVSISNELF